MRKQARWLWLPAAVGAGLWLAACGGGGQPPAGTDPAAGGAAVNGPAAQGPEGSSGAAPAEPKELRRMTVAYSPAAGPMVPLWIAVEEKIFQKYGLEVTPEFVGGSGAIVQAMAGGQYEIGVVGGGGVVTSRLGGSDLILIGSHGSQFSIDSWAQPEIRSIADLKGKTIAVSRLGSSTHFAALAMIASAGLKPDDVVILQAGGVGEALAALESGAAAAAMLSPPQNLLAEKAGKHRIALLSELGDYGLFAEDVIATRESWLKDPANREIAKNFLRAFQEAMEVAKTDAEVTKRALSKYTKIEDEESLQVSFDFYKDFFPPDLRVQEKSIANMLQFLDHPNAKQADPKSFYDNGLVEEILAGR